MSRRILALKAARVQPSPPHPSGVDRRPLDGFPHWYAIDRDKVVWSCRNKAGWPSPWRPLSTFMRGRKSSRVCVQLTTLDGRRVFRSVAGLYRSAFLRPQLPIGRTILPDWYDDDGDDEFDKLHPIAPPAPIAAPRRSLPAVEALPARRSQPATLDDAGDEFLKDPIERRSPRLPFARPQHPGGPAELGPMARGSGHPKARLDEEKVIEMRRLRSEGWKTSALAARYGVGRNTVCYALSGKTWGHVPGFIKVR